MTGVWPLRPNWRSPYSVSYQFKTEIITSDSGREQRRALRATPRKTVEFLVTAARDRFRALVRTLATQQGEQLVLPEITTGQPLLAAVVAGVSVLPVASVPNWLVAGESVVLVDSDRSELRVVQSVAAGSITLTGNASAWPAGALVCHALFGRFDGQARVQQIVKGLIEGKLEFIVDPASERPRSTGAATATWNGREVFLERANWAGRQTLTFTRPVNAVDYGYGVTETFLPVDFGGQIRTNDFLIKDRVRAAAMLAFFERMRGRQGEFYAPTDEPDIILAANLNSGTSSLQAVGTDLAAAYAGDKVNTAICVLMTNGQRFYRAVNGITVAGGRSILALGQVAPFLVTPATVQAISWMPVSRLASDEMTLDWLTTDVARTRFSFQSIETLPPE